VWLWVTKPHELKHVETVDKSQPVIDKTAHIGEAPQKKVFEEIKSGEHPLIHLDSTSDRSAPVIDKTAHIGEAPQIKLFEEIKKKNQDQWTETEETSTCE